MFLFFGINEKREDLDYDVLLVCDACGAYGRLQVFQTCMVFSLFFIPLFRFNYHYYAQTSCCNTLYEIEADTAKALLRGEISELKSSDLHLLYKGNGSVFKKCRFCGYETSEDFEFCPKCGNRF